MTQNLESCRSAPRITEKKTCEGLNCKVLWSARFIRCVRQSATEVVQEKKKTFCGSGDLDFATEMITSGVVLQAKECETFVNRQREEPMTKVLPIRMLRRCSNVSCRSHVQTP